MNSTLAPAERTVRHTISWGRRWGMTPTNRFVRAHNIENFRKLIASATGDAERATLARLLTEELAKDAEAQTPQNVLEEGSTS